MNRDADATAPAAAFSDPFPSTAPLRVLVFADMLGASQFIAFVDGLKAARSAGEAAVRIVDEEALGADLSARAGTAALEGIPALFDETAPTVVVLSRFGLSGAWEAVQLEAERRGVAVCFHVDDDLLDLPVTVGVERYRSGRHPRRVHVHAAAMARSDLVICATETLAGRLAGRLGHGRIGWLQNGSAGAPRPRASGPGSGPVVVGYMGSASHGADLEMIAPALNAVLASGGARFELYGSIAGHPAADLLPASTVRHPATLGDYSAFKRRLSALGWDIGLAPLRDSPYNRCKTATKWVEYAEAGCAVLASEMTVYQLMIDADAALPASPGQWEARLRRLIASSQLRDDMVARADRLLEAEFGWERLERSVLALLRRAALAGAGRRGPASLPGAA